MTNTNVRNNGAKSTAASQDSKPTGLDALLVSVADKARFLADRDVVALAAYIKARHGGTAFQPDAKKDVVFSVQFKNDEGTVLRQVAVVVAYGKGDYYTRFKVIVTANNAKRQFFPVGLDDVINILRDTANPYHYSNRIFAANMVEEKADEAASA